MDSLDVDVVNWRCLAVVLSNHLCKLRLFAQNLENRQNNILFLALQYIGKANTSQHNNNNVHD